MPYSPYERDLMIRTILGEARGQPIEGQAAVAHTILNRVKAGGYGEGIEGVVMKPKQFEPWTTRAKELRGYTPQTAGWADAERVVDDVLSGRAPDPTKGATHFANIATVQQRGDPAGREGGWLSRMGNRTQIGAHTFGNADAGRGGVFARAARAQPAPSVTAGTPVGQASTPAPAPAPSMVQNLANGTPGGAVGNIMAMVRGQNQGPSPLATAVATEGAKPNPYGGMGLVGMAMSPEGVTAKGLGGFLGSDHMKAGLAGVGMLAQGLGSPAGGQHMELAPVTTEENRPDMSLLELLRRKKAV